MIDIKEELFGMQDLEYKDFNSKLIPNINPDTVIGVRTPELRAYAKRVKNDDGINAFLNTLPHEYYEENNLHSFLIAQIPDFDRCVLKLNEFLPYVDNWATCDGIKPKSFKKNTDKLLPQIHKWLNSGHTYTVRFAIGMLMTYYLDDEFNTEYLHTVSGVQSEEYYINMMIAWYFATALAKQYDATIPYIEKKILPAWVHNKTIQKAIESYRITDEQKSYLRTLRS